MLPVPYIMGLVPAPNTARPSRPANGSRHRPPIALPIVMWVEHFWPKKKFVVGGMDVEEGFGRTRRR